LELLALLDHCFIFQQASLKEVEEELKPKSENWLLEELEGLNLGSKDYFIEEMEELLFLELKEV
jgi:hypothetical protein